MLLLFSADSRLEQVVDNHSFKTDVMINKVRPFSKGSFISHVDSLGGRGVRQMSTLLYNPCIVKWSTKGEGVDKVQKTVYVVYERPPTTHLCVQCK